MNIQFLSSHCIRASLLTIVAMQLAVAPEVVAQNPYEQLYDKYDAARLASRYVEAESHARGYLLLAKRNNKPSAVAIGRHLLAMALAGQDEFKEAEQEFRASTVLAQQQKVEWLVTSNLQELAKLQSRRGDYAQAERLFRQVLERNERELGPDHIDLTSALSHLADVCLVQHHHERAEPFLVRARSILEKHDDKQSQLHRDRLSGVLYNFGRLRYNQLRYAEAEQFWRQALRLDESLYGKDSPNVADILTSLTLASYALGRDDEVEALRKRALDINLRRYGPRHSATAHTQDALAEHYVNLGRFAEAEGLIRQSLQTRRQLFGRNHPDVARALWSLARLMNEQHRAGEALKLAEEARRIFESSFGPRDRRLFQVSMLRAHLLRELGRNDEAVRAFQAAGEMTTADTYDASMVYTELANTYQGMNRHAEAEPLLLRALKIKESTENVGREDFRLATVLQGLSRLYEVTGRPQRASETYDRWVAVLQTRAGAGGELANALAWRSDLAWKQSRYEDALRDLQQAMDLADQQRIQFSGGAHQRSQAFSNMTVIFEWMVRLQTELGDLNAALDAMERGRARSLIDQLRTQGVDLLQGVPEAEAERLRKQLSDAVSAIARIEREFAEQAVGRDVSDAEKQRRWTSLDERLRRAQKDYVVAQADIRNASPAYRLAVGENRMPIQLQALQRYVQERNALLLRYMIGNDGSYLLVVPPLGARASGGVDDRPGVCGKTGDRARSASR